MIFIGSDRLLQEEEGANILFKARKLTVFKFITPLPTTEITDLSQTENSKLLSHFLSKTTSLRAVTAFEDFAKYIFPEVPVSSGECLEAPPAHSCSPQTW